MSAKKRKVDYECRVFNEGMDREVVPTKAVNLICNETCCSVLRLLLHRAAMPDIFLSCFLFFVILLSAAQHLTPAVVCDSSFYYVYSCIIILCV